jgi:hypothetical protein
MNVHYFSAGLYLAAVLLFASCKPNHVDPVIDSPIEYLWKTPLSDEDYFNGGISQSISYNNNILVMRSEKTQLLLSQICDSTGIILQEQPRIMRGEKNMSDRNMNHTYQFNNLLVSYFYGYAGEGFECFDLEHNKYAWEMYIPDSLLISSYEPLCGISELFFTYGSYQSDSSIGYAKNRIFSGNMLTGEFAEILDLNDIAPADTEISLVSMIPFSDSLNTYLFFLYSSNYESHMALYNIELQAWEYTQKPFPDSRVSSGNIVENAVLYIGGINLHAVSMLNGSIQWSTNTNGFSLKLIIYENLLIGATDRHILAAFDKKTGQKIWEIVGENFIIPEIHILENIIYYADRQNLFVVNAQNGTIIKTFENETTGFFSCVMSKTTPHSIVLTSSTYAYGYPLHINSKTIQP